MTGEPDEVEMPRGCSFGAAVLAVGCLAFLAVGLLTLLAVVLAAALGGTT